MQYTFDVKSSILILPSTFDYYFGRVYYWNDFKLSLSQTIQIILHWGLSDRRIISFKFWHLLKCDSGQLLRTVKKIWTINSFKSVVTFFIPIYYTRRKETVYAYDNGLYVIESWKLKVYSERYWTGRQESEIYIHVRNYTTC